MIESLAAAIAEVGFSGGNQALGLFDDLARLQRRSRRLGFGDAVALFDIEDGKTLEERYGVGAVALLCRALLFGLGNKAVGVTDGDAAFAFAHLSADGVGLAQGEPAVRAEIAADNRIPQDQDIDSGIMPPGGGVLGHCQPGFGLIPRAHPWDTALFQFGNDPVCDLLIKIGAGLSAR